MQLTGFEGRVALVTGAAGGIGEALVRLLVEAGCIVVATDREAPRVADSRVTSLALDVANSAAVDALVDQVESSIGPIMLAASVAGVLHVGRVAETGDADWRRVFAVNADGVFHVGRALARVMSPRRMGRDRYRQLECSRRAAARHGHLCGIQGRRHHVHPLPRAGTGAAGHPLQHRRPGLDVDPDADRHVAGRARCRAGDHAAARRSTRPASHCANSPPRRISPIR